MPKVSLLKNHTPGTELQSISDSMSCFLSLLPVKMHIFPSAPKAGVGPANEKQAVSSPRYTQWSNNKMRVLILACLLLVMM